MKVVKSGYQGIVLPELNIGFDGSGSGAGHWFISHAHADHMPRNRQERVYCTNFTLELMRKRGFKGRATLLEFGRSLELQRARITLYPAGHILGSAMTYVESDRGNLLYTGDCRTPPSPATEGFKLPGNVDHLVTEATFGLPVYRWDSIESLARQVRDFAQNALERDATPLFLAYNLGKAQEILHMLAPLGHPAQIHEAGYPFCEVYRRAGIDLGECKPYDRDRCEGKILITPRSALNNGFASHIGKRRIAYCSGWAAREATRAQMRVDKLIPLSDHLDFFELIGLCEKLEPEKVYITHTPNASVVSHFLDRAGIDSLFLDR